MDNQQFSDKSQLLTDLPPYIYGTTRLGDGNIPFEDRVKVARAAVVRVLDAEDRPGPTAGPTAGEPGPHDGPGDETP